ncbi:hypothetical protein [Sorangium sp. So ce381]|uniref:hypothetical protein n=1 Tax=Sorangium sp. So ce381 TaxID=3133307 RepID=UPI003F5B8646
MSARRSAAAVLTLAAGLAAVRPAAGDGGPVLTIAEAPGNEIAVTQLSAGLERTLHIEETGGAEVPSLRVDARLTGPDGSAVPVVCAIAGRDCKDGVRLDRYGSADVVLSATLGLVGVHSGALVLVHAKREPRPLQITRALGPTPWDVSAPAVVAGEDGGATIRLLVRDKRVLPPSTPTPRLVGVRCKAGDAAEADPGGVTLDSPPIATAPEGTSTPTLKVNGLPSAGACEVDLVLAVDGAEPAQKTVKVLLRRSPWRGVALVALGVAISYLLRRHFVVSRPSRSIRRRAMLALRRLEATRASAAPFKADEGAVIEQIYREIRRISARRYAGLSAPAEAEIEAIEKKVELFVDPWLRMRRRAEAVAGLDATAAEPIDRAIADAAKALCDPGAASAKLDTCASELASAEPGLAKAIDTHLRKPLSTIENELAEQPAELRRVLTPKLREAKQALDAGAPWRARPLIDEVQRDYARSLARTLEASLPETRPAGFKDEAWKEVSARTIRLLRAVAEETEGARALERYRSTHLDYLRQLVGALAVKAETYKAAAEKYSAKQVDVTTFTTAKNDAAKALDEMSLGRAVRKYADAVSAGEDLDKAIAAITGTQLGSPGQIPQKPAPPGPASAMEPVTLYGSGEAPFFPELADFDRSTELTEAGVALVLVAIAIVSGVHALKLQGPTWGTGIDQLEALLWGLGLHQVSGAVFGGISALRRQLGE